MILALSCSQIAAVNNCCFSTSCNVGQERDKEREGERKQLYGSFCTRLYFSISHAVWPAGKAALKICVRNLSAFCQTARQLATLLLQLVQGIASNI
jgi:hypothetical protein